MAEFEKNPKSRYVKLEIRNKFKIENGRNKNHRSLSLNAPDRSEFGCMYYMNEAAEQNWSVRALERQINSFYYERILASHGYKKVMGQKLA